MVTVLEENWDAVRVFRRCRPNWLTGFHAPIYDGIDAAELRAATCLLRIPRVDLPELLQRVDTLVDATGAALSHTP